MSWAVVRKTDHTAICEVQGHLSPDKLQLREWDGNRRFPIRLSTGYTWLLAHPRATRSIAFGIWIVFLTLGFFLNRKSLFAAFDGTFSREGARWQFEVEYPIGHAAMDFLASLGDMGYMVNFRLFPSFLLLELASFTDFGKIICYDCLATELTLSIILFALALGVGYEIGFAAAVMCCTLVLPLYGTAIINIQIALVPHVGSIMAVALLICALFLHVGRCRYAETVLTVLLIQILFIWIYFASIIIFILIAPFIAVTNSAALLACRSRGELVAKLACVAVALVVFACGPIEFLYALLTDTAATFFPSELLNDKATWYNTSILFHGSYNLWSGPLLVIGCIGSVAALALRPTSSRTLKINVLALVSYLLVRIVFGAINIHYIDLWRGPSPLYFEFAVIPAYCIFLICGINALAGARLRHAICGLSPSLIVALAVGPCLPILGMMQRPAYLIAWPPKANPIIDDLRTTVGLRNSAPFAGRVENVTGGELTGKVDWPTIHGLDVLRIARIGNDMRSPGLDYFSIPHLFPYTSTISPVFYAFMTRLLSLPTDRQMRNIVLLRHYRENILRLIGVRYLISDTELNITAKRNIIDERNDSILNLYEISDVNTGNWSPTNIVLNANAQDILAMMSKNDFDPKTNAILHRDVQTSSLVPATSSELLYRGTTLALRAESVGQSLLLLPMEFSACLKKVDHGQATDLVRADLLLTGVLFSGKIDTDISFQTGPFTNPMCRLIDKAQQQRMGLSTLAVFH